jgi:hypothetical protein
MIKELLNAYLKSYWCWTFSIFFAMTSLTAQDHMGSSQECPTHQFSNHTCHMQRTVFVPHGKMSLPSPLCRVPKSQDARKYELSPEQGV